MARVVGSIGEDGDGPRGNDDRDDCRERGRFVAPAKRRRHTVADTFSRPRAPRRRRQTIPVVIAQPNDRESPRRRYVARRTRLLRSGPPGLFDTVVV